MILKCSKRFLNENQCHKTSVECNRQTLDSAKTFKDNGKDTDDVFASKQHQEKDDDNKSLKKL